MHLLLLPSADHGAAICAQGQQNGGSYSASPTPGDTGAFFGTQAVSRPVCLIKKIKPKNVLDCAIFVFERGSFREGRFERGSEGRGLCPASFGYDSNDEDRTMRGYVASLACMHVAMPMFAEDRGEDINRKPFSCFCSYSAASDEMPFFAGRGGRRLGCWCPEEKCRRTDPEDGQLRQVHR